MYRTDEVRLACRLGSFGCTGSGLYRIPQHQPDPALARPFDRRHLPLRDHVPDAPSRRSTRTCEGVGRDGVEPLSHAGRAQHTENRFEALLPLPTDRSVLRYRYKFEFTYPGVLDNKINSTMSPEYELQLGPGAARN